MSDERIDYEWKLSKDGPPWIIIDWAGNSHEFPTQKDQRDFLERDKRMFADATREANSDIITQITDQFQAPEEGLESGDGEQAVDDCSEGETPGKGVGSQGNRQSRRRAARAANRKKTPR